MTAGDCERGTRGDSWEIGTIHSGQAARVFTIDLRCKKPEVFSAAARDVGDRDWGWTVVQFFSAVDG